MGDWYFDHGIGGELVIVMGMCRFNYVGTTVVDKINGTTDGFQNLWFILWLNRNPLSNALRFDWVMRCTEGEGKSFISFHNQIFQQFTSRRNALVCDLEIHFGIA